MIASAIASLAQTGVSIAGMVTDAKRNKKALSYLNEEHKAYDPTKYKVSSEFMSGIQDLKTDSKTGFSDRTIRGFVNSAEDTRKSNVGLAKETSGGSGGNAFTRAVSAGVTKNKEVSDFITKSEEYKGTKLSRYIGALGQLEGMNFSADQSYQGLKADQAKFDANTALQKYQLASGQQAAWGDAVQSGIANTVGSLQYMDFMKKLGYDTKGGGGKDPKFKKGAIGKGTEPEVHV